MHEITGSSFFDSSSFFLFSVLFSLFSFISFFSLFSLFSLLFSAGGFFNASCPFIIKFVVRNKSDYRTLYFVVGIMNLIALVALFTFKDKPFEYKLKDEKEDGKKEVELEEKLN